MSNNLIDVKMLPYICQQCMFLTNYICVISSFSSPSSEPCLVVLLGLAITSPLPPLSFGGPPLSGIGSRSFFSRSPPVPFSASVSLSASEYSFARELDPWTLSSYSVDKKGCSAKS